MSRQLFEYYSPDKANIIVESSKDGKDMMMSGLFIQGEVKNQNGRVYPKEEIQTAVESIGKRIQTGETVLGELDHPAELQINLDRVSHMITDMRCEGADGFGKLKILDTPMGKIVKGLLDGGVQLGVSTRGMGSLEQQNGAMVVKDDFVLSTVDIVQDPSAPDAFVNGIMEGVDWVWNNGVLKPQVIEKMETEIKTAPKPVLYETSVREFKNFLSLLKSSM